jgi:hypothetical protein
MNGGKETHPPSFLKIKLNGAKITPSKSVKYLGVHLDDTLSSISHCNQLLPKLRRANGMLAKARHYLPTTQILSLYYATFASHLNYGCQIWSQHPNTLLKKIVILQKNAVRIITFSEFKAHTRPIFKELKILKFNDQVELLNCLFVHDQLNNLLPASFNDYFTATNNLKYTGTRTFNTGKLFVPFAKSTRYGRHSIKHSCILSWNHCIKQFPNTDFMTINRHNMKKLITN